MLTDFKQLFSIHTTYFNCFNYLVLISATTVGPFYDNIVTTYVQRTTYVK
jgi:hypothetical protein